jgi:asparagine synthase (glutamine-hydrolysing)
MCGIFGIIGKKQNEIINENTILNNLKNRGPDAFGKWKNDENSIYIGHTRLAVIDLSQNGSQPMTSSSGRYLITYNGEIYNFKEIKKEIEKKNSQKIWRGNSDTEVLCESIELFGLEKTLEMCDGMFAFGVYDKKRKNLTLVRDQFGEKPLYYGFIKENFFFSSDLSVVKSLINCKLKINKTSVNLLAKYSYIPSPNTIYQDIFKLEPLHYLKIDIDQLNKFNKNFKLKTQPWKKVNTSINYNFNQVGFDDICLKVETLLNNSVKSRMISDVPIGSFLSGGIDSSLITALMQRNSSKKIETFSIGQSDKRFDETGFAKDVAKRIGTNHNEYIVEKKHILESIRNINDVYSEPFADSSQIPSIILSKYVKKKVTVALTGDGGDELFGGYNRYLYSNSVLSFLKYSPYGLRKIFAKVGKNIGPKKYNKFLNFLSLKISNPGDKIHKIFDKLESIKNEKELYLSLITEWNKDSDLFNNKIDDQDDHIEMYCKKIDFSNNVIEKMMNVDVKYYLPDDILCKVDRSSMFSSLETRVPFLNKDVYDLANNLPLNFKIKENKGKIILRKILSKYLPNNLIDRPKMGFSIPIDNYLRNDLREWGNELVNKSYLYEEYFNKNVVKKFWDEHCSGKRNWQTKLWPILSFISWNESQ